MRPEELDDVYAHAVLEKRGELLLRELAELKRRRREDSIHDTRVQSRRMRAALEAFQDLFAPRDWEPVYTSVRRITRYLGRVREAEVTLGLISDVTAGSDTSEMLAAEYLKLRLARGFLRLHKRLKRNLRKTDVRTLRSKFMVLLSGVGRLNGLQFARDNVIALRAAPNARPPAASKSRQPTLFALHGETIERARRVLSELADPLLAFRPRRDFRRATDTRLHKLRIQAKKLRYAMEVFDEPWPGGLEGPIELARAFQEAGGHYQDWAVIRCRLMKEARRLTKQEAPQLVCQIGRIVEQVESRKAILRSALLPAFTTLQAAVRELLEGFGMKAASAGDRTTDRPRATGSNRISEKQK